MKPQWVYIPHGDFRGERPFLISSEEDVTGDKGGVSG